MSPSETEAPATLSRRSFLSRAASLTGAAALAALNLGAVPGQETGRPKTVRGKKSKSKFPIVISTWGGTAASTKKAGELLLKGRSGLDAVEGGINLAEDDPENQSVGLGGLPDENGVVTLDASIMDGPRRACGSIAGLEDVRNAVSVARKVMEETDHVMLVGAGAKQFALAMGFQEENLLTEKSRQAWLAWKKSGKKGSWGNPNWQNHDTIGLLVLDENQNLFGGVSTSGLSWKIHGRVGDSPIIGAGLFADNEVGAACATGRGEEVIKVCGSFLIVELMRQGRSPEEACFEALRRIRKNNPKRTDFSEAFLAISKEGEIGAAYFGGEFTYAVFRPDQQETRKGKPLP